MTHLGRLPSILNYADIDGPNLFSSLPSVLATCFGFDFILLVSLVVFTSAINVGPRFLI